MSTATPVRVLAVIALGGGLGCIARNSIRNIFPAAPGQYLIHQAFPTSPGQFPMTTFLINVTGCLLMGALTAFVGLRRPSGYLQPLLGTGFLGGFTTFSDYSREIRDLLAKGAVGIGLLYAVASILIGVCAVWLGVRAVRLLWGVRR